MGEGCVPWSKVDRYAQRWHLNDQEFEELWEVVQRLDMVYIEHRAAKAKIDQSRLGHKTPPRRRGP